MSPKPQLENAAGSVERRRVSAFKYWNPDKYAKHPSAVKTSRKTLEWSVYFSVFLSQSLSSQGRGKDVRIPLHYYSFFCPVGSKALIILGEGERHGLAYRFLFYFFYCQPRWSQKRQLVARNQRLCESQKSHWKYSDHLSIYRIKKQAQMQSAGCSRSYSGKGGQEAKWSDSWINGFPMTQTSREHRFFTCSVSNLGWFTPP